MNFCLHSIALHLSLSLQLSLQFSGQYWIFPIRIGTVSLRCRAVKRQTKWSAPKLTNFEIDVGPGSGTLMKPKYHSMGVGGLLVQELEPGKDLKAEKG